MTFLSIDQHHEQMPVDTDGCAALDGIREQRVTPGAAE